MRSPSRYAWIGFLLGWGAPIGAILLRVAGADAPPAALAQEWQTARFYYLYMTAGTTLAFGLFGYALGRRNQDLNELSHTDGLTGAYNHRYLQQQLSKEILRSDRYRTPLTCMMLDIDDFKKVNDGHGHLFGDQVLALIARQIRDAVRETDLVGRYGGEEFLVIMPQTTMESAAPLAERVLSTISHYPFKAESGPVSITVSIGLAAYPAPANGVKSKNAVLSAADQALYQAKLAGKNQAKIWTP